MDHLAIYFEPSAYSLKGRVMGRQSAGVAFMRALAGRQPNKLWCFASSRDGAAQCAQSLLELGSRTGIVHVPFAQPARLAEAGLLYRPDPGIEQDAWRRLTHSNPRAYSLCGITHTTASHAVMSALANLPLAPLEDWDALICTSRAVRDSVRVLVENQIGYLRERVDATRFSLPQLPVIPLGVHCGDYAFTDEQRVSARSSLGIEPDEVVVLFVGRLVFHGKAHPAPLYQALEACARGRKITLLQAGWYPIDEIEQAYRKDAETLCPSIRYLHVDGRDQDRLKLAWAAGDIFTSLSDNIQETFGLTPIEAMAAGLPVVVTDWDGYRDTVRDGIDGFRVPTLSLPPGLGDELADRFDQGLDSYDMYCGYASQLVAVDVAATTEAFRRLIDDGELRRRMGEAGRQRARREFDWSVIFQRYEDLWADLGERRRSNAMLAAPLTRRRRPDRADPFAMFESYPSSVVSAGTSFRRIGDLGPELAIARRDLSTVRFASRILPTPDVIQKLLDAVPSDAWRPFSEIVSLAAPLDRRIVAASLVWLSKVGVIAFQKAG